MRCLIPLLCVLLVSGCAKGIDRSLITGEGIENYQISLQRAGEEMTPEEREAFDWAVSDFDLARLHQVYPNASPREIIRGEVRNGLAEWSARLAQLEAQKAKFDPIVAELRKIEASEIEVELDRGFNGLLAEVHAKVVNRSELGVSSLRWRASLYLDDGEEPVAVSEVFDDYNDAGLGPMITITSEAPIPAGGMRPGQEYARTFRLGLVSDDKNWTTLAVQDASKRVVVLEPILETIKDFSDREYLEGAPYREIRALQAAIESAKKYEHI